MFIDISKLPAGFKLEVTKEDLIAFADRLLEEKRISGNNPEEEQPVNIKEVAEILDVSVQHVYSLTSQKKIPHLKRGKKLYFLKSEILSWLKEGKRKTEKEIDELANEFLERNRRKRKL